MKIWAHTLVKNEERYLWYAISSIVGFVDKVLLWDTGSTDNTIKVVKKIQKLYPNMIDFKEMGSVTPAGYTELRQSMLAETTSDWFLILDGDEVWWEDSIKRAVSLIKREWEKLDSVVVPMVYPIGDLYHYQEEIAGKYQIDGRTGHLAVKFINRSIPGLYTTKPHGQHGYYDEKNALIQERSSEKRRYIDAPFMHFTHMIRSSSLKQDLLVPKREIKYKHELGTPFPLDFYYPEVFFRPKPEIIPSPWAKMDSNFFIRAAVETPLRKVKRRIWQGKVGY